VEEASAAAGSLEEQSKALVSAVAVFRLAEEQALAKPVEPKKPVVLKKPVEPRKAVVHAIPAKKGNGHLEEGWQEF